MQRHDQSKLPFEEIECKLIQFSAEDVITTSIEEDTDGDQGAWVKPNA